MEKLPTRYLRFAVTEVDATSRKSQGIFHAAGVLLEFPDLTQIERKVVQEATDWFEANLPTPESSRITPNATFWFRVEATECICRAWLIVDLLRSHGYLVEIQRLRWLNLVYQDEFQAAGYVPKS